MFQFCFQTSFAQNAAPGPLAKEPEKVKKSSSFAKINRSDEIGIRIPGLTIPVNEVPIFLIQKTDEVRSLVVIPYDLELAPGAKLVIDDRTEIPVPKNREQRNFYLYLTGKTNALKVTLISGADKFSEMILVEAPQAQEFQVAVPWDAVRMGISSVLLAYKQTGYSDFYSWNGQLSLNYHTPEKIGRIGINLDVDSTVFTAKGTEGYYPQLLTGRADLIYPFITMGSPLTTYYLGAGMTYSSLSSNGAPFGFKSLLAAEMTFRMRYLVNKKTDYYGSVSFSPLNSSVKDFILQLEVSRSFLLRNLHRSELGFRIFDLNHHPDPQNAVRAVTYALFLTYSI